MNAHLKRLQVLLTAIALGMPVSAASAQSDIYWNRNPWLNWPGAYAGGMRGGMNWFGGASGGTSGAYGGASAAQDQMHTGSSAAAAAPSAEEKDLSTLLTASGVPNKGGQVVWPLGLRILADPEADALRAQIDAQLHVAAVQAAVGRPDERLFKKITGEVKTLRQLLLKDKEERFTMPLTVYTEAERFLKSLQKAPSTLRMTWLPPQETAGWNPAGGKGNGGSGSQTAGNSFYQSNTGGNASGQGSSGGNASGNSSDTYSAAGETGQERQPVYYVVMYDNYFEPNTITISVGMTVQWTNYGEHKHTVTADDGTWGSDELGPLAIYDRTFARPGTYTYHCTNHAREMRGTIIVK